MSLQSATTITCPHCKHPTDISVWRTVNVTLHPALREQVLKGTLFEAACSHCQNLIGYDSDLLYHDMDRKFMIQLIHTERNMPFTIPPFNVALAKVGLTTLQLRYVTSYNQLRDKIAVFEAGLLDVPIEILKMMLWTQVRPNTPITDDSVYFYRIADVGTPTATFVFCLFDGTTNLGTWHLSCSLYTKMFNTLKEDELRQGYLGKWHLINQSNTRLKEAISQTIRRT